MDGYITRGEHLEFAKRMEEEHHRQNKRINAFEEALKQQNQIAIAVEKMAMNMEQMLKEQMKQGERLEELEKTPAKKWNTVTTSILSAIGGAIGAAIIAVMVFGLMNQL